MENLPVFLPDNKLESEGLSTLSQNNLSSSLAVIEELVSNADALLSLLPSLRSALTPDKFSLLESISTALKGYIDIIDNNSQPLEIVLDKASPASNSLIHRLGLGGEVIRRRKMGESITKIANSLNINSSTLSRFYKYYDQLKPSQQSSYQRSSVFDTSSRLEELKNLIVRRIYALEGVNDDVARQYTTELRQTYTLATQIAEKIANYEQYKRFTKSVYELLKDELPHKRKDILRKIQSLESEEMFLK